MEEIEIPLGAFDSETVAWTYTIPEGFTAKIEDGKIIVEKKESEDERMCKHIIDIVRNNAELKNIPCDAEIAWLEKQKEPVPIPDKFSGLKSLMLQYLQSAANRKDDSEIEEDTDLWGRKMLDYVWKQEKQKEIRDPFDDDQFRRGDEAGKHDAEREQKPAEIHIDNPNIQEFDPDVKVTTSDSSANGKEFLYVSNKSYHIGFRDGVASVKPAERSEEDETMRESCMLYLANARDCVEFSQYIGDNAKRSGKQRIQSCIDWLKSLRPQPHTVSVENATKFGSFEYERGVKDGIQSEKSRQWKPSKEEIDAFENLLKGEFPNKIFPGATLANLLNKLKNLYYNEAIQVWRPSEEQMDALFDASERNDKLGFVLVTLYNDLKKL